MKARLFDDALLRALAAEHGTPLYVYDAATMLARVSELRGARHGVRGFDVVRYAQKANPNLALLELLRRAGVAVDAVSAGELERALAVGYRPEEVLFCADLFDAAALERVARLPFRVNVGSPDMLEQYAAAGPPRRDVALRINPGFGHGHDHKVTTGGERSKHGLWYEDVPSIARRVRELGLEVAGLHVHIGSGVDPQHLTRACEALVEAARPFEATLTFLSAGGGLPIPYREGEPRIDLAQVLAAWNDARETLEGRTGRTLSLEVEPGRYLVAEAGLLLAEVRAVKRSGGIEYALVDAGFHNLIRPAMYGAFHEISVLGRDREARTPIVVAGPLCESADVFTVSKSGEIEPRALPRPRVGDLLCIHDAGAYGASMSSGYNSQLPAPEILVNNGRARIVRCRPTWSAYLEPELRCLE